MNVGDRLVLEFIKRGAPSGRAGVVCRLPGARTSQVVRVTRQDHDTDHAPTHYRCLTVASSRLRAPTAAELADDSLQKIWQAIERARFRV